MPSSELRKASKESFESNQNLSILSGIRHESTETVGRNNKYLSTMNSNYATISNQKS